MWTTDEKSKYIIAFLHKNPACIGLILTWLVACDLFVSTPIVLLFRH